MTLRSMLSVCVVLVVASPAFAKRGWTYAITPAIKQSQAICVARVEAMGSGRTRMTLQVEQILKGDLPERADVAITRGGKPTSISLQIGKQYLVFLFEGNVIRFPIGPLEINRGKVRCSYNAVITWEPLDETLKYIRDLVTPDMAQLIEEARTGDVKVRIYSLRILGHLGSEKAKAGLPAIVEAIQDQDDFVRDKGIWAAGEFGPGAKDAVPALIQILRDRLNGYFNAAQALGKIGLDAEPALPELIRLLKDGPIYAAMGLGGIRSEEAVPALIEALGSTSGQGAQWCAWALGQLGPRARAAIPALLVALKDGEDSTRRSAASALGQIGDKTAAPGLIDALRDEHLWPRGEAARSLGLLGAKEAVPALRKALEEERGGAREEMEEALETIESIKELSNERVQPTGKLVVQPKLLHISSRVDGSGRIVFTPESVRYEHKHWGRPNRVLFDGEPWTKLGRTPTPWDDFGRRLDLSKAWIVKRKGRDVIALEHTPDGFDIYLCDSPNGGADYAVTIAIPRRK